MRTNTALQATPLRLGNVGFFHRFVLSSPWVVFAFGGASQLGVRALSHQCQLLSSNTWFLLSIVLGSEVSLEVRKDVAERSHPH